MNSQNIQTSNTENGISNEESKIIKRFFSSLILTVKNLSLYPPGHTICTTSINKFYTQLTAFLKKYGSLRIDIERERIICQGVIISESIPEEGTLHYTLFRDGIRWLELMDGIKPLELTDIFLLINKYTKLSAEPEGDIVTAFWEIQFPHMQYEVAELLWGGDRNSGNFNDIISGKSSLSKYVEPDKREKEYKSDPPIDMAKVILTTEEETALQEMIRMEEEADRTSYLDALLDSLLQNREEVNFSKIIDALSEEFTFSLARKDFVITLKILQGLQYILDICREELPWAVKLIEDFFFKVSGVEFLAPLKDIWGKTDPDDTAVLQDIFRLLNPKSIQMLLALLPLSKTVPQKKVLQDLIILIASQNTNSLELVLKNANENLVEGLFMVISKMEDGQSMKYLSRLSNHPSGTIRYEAVKAILKLEPSRVRDMLDLIDDSEDSIRQLILDQMGQSKDDVIEEFLISFIKKNKSGNIDGNFIIRCFRMLGRCGSFHSIPFLRETLLKWGFLSGSRRSLFRRGSAIALGTLGIAQADEVLERAGRSLFPGVKNIVIKVRQELREEAGNSAQ